MKSTISSIRTPPVNLSEKDKSLFEHEYQYKYDVKEPYIINDVTIVDDYIFTKKNVLLNETKINFHNSFNNPLKILFKIFFKKTVYKKRQYKCAIWVIDCWSCGYFHWMTDVLQRIIEAKNTNINIPILLPENYKNYSYVTESLKFLNTDVTVPFGIWLIRSSNPAFSKLFFTFSSLGSLEAATF